MASILSTIACLHTVLRREIFKGLKSIHHWCGECLCPEGFHNLISYQWYYYKICLKYRCNMWSCIDSLVIIMRPKYLAWLPFAIFYFSKILFLIMEPDCEIQFKVNSCQIHGGWSTGADFSLEFLWPSSSSHDSIIGPYSSFSSL
jgi:hypothetical protein